MRLRIKKLSVERAVQYGPIMYISLILLMVVFNGVVLASALNFGGSSPDSGEADAGSNTGIFDTQTGTFQDTRSDNNVYFVVARDSGNNANASQRLAFNISALSMNSSLTITQINFTAKYCHAKEEDDVCDSSSSNKPKGTNYSMNIWLYNVSGAKWLDIGDIRATTEATETTVVASVSGLLNYSQFIASNGFVNLSLDFIWDGSSQSAFLNDYSYLTVSYDVVPVVTLSTPVNASFIDPANVTFNCSFSDDVGNVSVTLYHNLNGSFIPLNTTTVPGKQNSTTFTLLNVSEREDGYWNCLVTDAVHSVFASRNYSIDTTGLNMTLGSCVPENATVGYPVQCNATIVDNLGISSAFANITLPNGTRTTLLATSAGSMYTFTLSNPSNKGNYYFVWNVNDTRNNRKTATGNFSVTNTAPEVYLVAPLNNTTTENKSINFTFYYIDDTTNASCALLLNATLNDTAILANNTIASFAQNLTDGSYLWSVQCRDNLNITTTSETRYLNITTPVIISESASSGGSSGSGGGGGGGTSSTKTQQKNETSVSPVVLEPSSTSVDNNKNNNNNNKNNNSAEKKEQERNSSIITVSEVRNNSVAASILGEEPGGIFNLLGLSIAPLRNSEFSLERVFAGTKELLATVYSYGNYPLLGSIPLKVPFALLFISSSALYVRRRYTAHSIHQRQKKVIHSLVKSYSSQASLKKSENIFLPLPAAIFDNTESAQRRIR